MASAPSLAVVATEAEIEAAELKMRLTAAAFAEMVDDEALQTERAADEVERRRLVAEAAWEAYQRLLGE